MEYIFFIFFIFFFFQAEDGIRDHCVTGVQTCALPIYFGDPIVRRAASLQRTRDALPPRAWVGPVLAQKLGVKAGERVRVRQGEGEAIGELGIDERLPAGCVRLADAHRHTASLGPSFGTVSVDRT